jgi:carboxymethylenebutenolidase
VVTTLSTGTSAHLALRPGAGRGLVIVPDIGGLRPLFTDLCERLADEHGWSVAAVEPWPGREDMEIGDRLASVGTLDDARLLADLAEAADLLDVEPVAVLGFCMGGMVALKAAASGRFDRAVSFYGMVRLPEHWVSDTVGETLDALAAAERPRSLLTPEEFESVAQAALDELPQALLDELNGVAILIDDRPSPEMVADGIDPRILGLYHGVPLNRRSASFGAPYADTIHLFRANLERVFSTRAELAAHIRVTVLHETAHFFGYSEGQLRSMGLA